MAFSNDQTQIKAGLVNYVGALLSSSPYEGKAARQNVFAILIEEALKMSQDEKGTIDMFVAKPLLRGVKLIFDQRIQELEKIKDNANSQLIEPVIESYKDMKDEIAELINKIE